MADIFAKEKRSEIMSKIHQPTKLERRVHNWLCGKHIRHTMYPKTEGNPDIELRSGTSTSYVFIDGCFWHMCPAHYRRPKSNRKFWVPHIEESNLRRERLRRALKYRWVRLWEHDIRDGSFKAKLVRFLR